MKYLKIFLTLDAIIAYAIVVTYVCKESLNSSNEAPKFTDALIALNNGLIGLVTGIVAAAFGVQVPDKDWPGKSWFDKRMNVLGNFVTDGTLGINEKGSKEF